MTRPPVRWPTAYLDDHLVTAVEDRATGGVVPPHAGSGPLQPAQYHRARVRIAIEQLAMLVEDLEDCPASVRQAACTALAHVVELQALLQGQAP